MIKDIIRLLIEKNFRFCAFSLPHKNFELFIEWPGQAPNPNLCFEFAPFNGKKHPKIKLSAHIIIDENSSKKELQALQSKLAKSVIQPFIKNVGNGYCESQKEYIRSLENAINGMPDQELEKFIYSRISSIPLENINVWSLLQKLSSKYPQTLTYYFQHPATGCWLGATPETLGNWQGNNFKTMSLAGTRSSFADLHHWGQKEREEQAYVTQFIQNVFEKEGIPQATDKTEVIQAGPVYHLRNFIESEGAISFNQAKRLITKLHPTPAICGVPMQRAKEFIDNTEKHDRTYYTGYLGIVEINKRIELFVNLRCMQILPNYVDLYLGGGITQKSSAQAEWMETEHKANTLLNVLNAQ